MSFFIIPILISIVLGFLLFSISKNNSKELLKSLTEEHVIIRLPKAYMWVGIIDVLIWTGFIILMTVFPNETTTIWVYLLFSLFVLVGAFLILESLVWKIEIFRSEDFFIYRTFYLKIYKVQYNDCVNYRIGENTLFIKTKERTFHIDIHAVNYEIFLAMLCKHKVSEIKIGK